MEQELASIIHFVLKSTGNPSPYYDEVPQDFLVPAAYFPPPEIMGGGGTTDTYRLDYSWYLKLFHKDTPSAMEMGRLALTALNEERCRIPKIAEDGSLTEEIVRVQQPHLKKLAAAGAAQLTISWQSYRAYRKEEYQKTMEYYINIQTRRGGA